MQFIQIVTGADQGLTKAKYNDMSISLEEFSLTRRMDEIDCIQRKAVCCMEMATKLFETCRKGQSTEDSNLLAFGFKDSNLRSDEKLNWIKEISFNFFQ